MFDDFNICPYPGLRSFTEEESLFFKGRESHIEEITQQLEQNKFLMVTGASGDGKSSIIFAGLIPNIRAGFFKAQYNSWRVAQFRPERSPVRNFARSLAPQLGHESSDSVETELRRGYGSLVDVYKNSDLYIDPESSRWKDANKEDQTEQLRIASNLLIVVDQFEEFFTNSENFSNGVPSQESQILINLLLETTRIAIKEDLPIYVVFTMRSDFIGQCAAFRGLPEFIGYSQFFVPRLNRSELKQVIEEPAMLNGNSISRRLVERLLYDLSEGIDQLPILQHALNQIWHKADNGKSELDLIHYAMVGGMPSDDLPNEDQDSFNAWFEQLSDTAREHLGQPGLNRVLDNHANELYESAWQYYNDQGLGKKISSREAKLIIALTFAGLTKIDDSRAVRSIMTLEEVTNIINQPHLDYETVGAVINLFREQGNTFIRPFILEEDQSSRTLSKDTPLDITHESLIRNWERLKQWAEKEFEYYETYLDFKKQLDKWIESGKSRGYLLPIGPLTYFENWYQECRPNKYWINRYEAIINKDQSSLERSEEILNESKTFLKRSAGKVALSRAYIKHGSSKAAVFLAVILVLVLSGFYYLDARKKQNQSVLTEIKERAANVLNGDEVGAYQKALYLISLERLEEGRLLNTARNLDSALHRVEVARAAYEIIMAMDHKFDHPIKYELIDFVDSELAKGDLDEDTRLEEQNDFIYTLVSDDYHNKDSRISEALSAQLDRIPGILTSAIQSGEVENNIDFNQLIEAILNRADEPDVAVKMLLRELSPFDPSSKGNFDAFYPLRSGIPNGRVGGMTHNGGYQIMAYLYAQQGNLGMAKQCTDSLLKYNSNYWQLMTYNNGYNTLGYFLQYKHFDKAEQFLSYLISSSGQDPMSFFQLMTDRTGFLKYAYIYNHFDIPNYNTGLALLPYEGVEWIFEKYKEHARDIVDPNLRHYHLALINKQEATYLYKHFWDKGVEVDKARIRNLFDEFYSEYRQIDGAFLDEQVQVSHRYYTNGFRNLQKPRWYMIKYPDHYNRGWFNDKYIGYQFVEYLIGEGLFNEFYSNVSELELLNDWLANYNERYPDLFNGNEIQKNKTPLTTEVLLKVEEALKNHPSNSSFDNTLIDLELASRHFEAGDSEKALANYRNIDHEQLQVTANRWEYLNLTYIDNLILNIGKEMAQLGDFNEAIKLAETMPNNNYKSVVYSRLASFVYTTSNKKAAFVFLDSAFTKGDKVDQSQVPFQFDHRYYLTNTLSGIGGKDLNDMAFDIFVELPPGLKDFALQNYFIGIATEGNYYRAMQAIPPEFSEGSRMGPYIFIMNEAANTAGNDEGWEQVAGHINWVFKDYVVFDANF